MDRRDQGITESQPNPLRAAREKAGLSQLALAERAGMSLAWVSTVERAPGLMTPRVARLLSSALGVTADELLAARALRRTLFF